MNKFILSCLVTFSVFIGGYYLVNKSNNLLAKKGKPFQDPVVNFYFLEDNKHVGFSVEGVAKYKLFEYSVEYNYGNNQTSVIEGTVDNSKSSKSNIIERKFYLGTCSSLGVVCVDHDYSLPITLTIKYGKNLQNSVTTSIDN